MTYKGFNPVQFARTSSTTLAHHIREVEQAFLRNFQLGALLEANGRVSYNHGGEGFDWPVQYRIHNVEGNTGETQRNFARRNLWKTANLEYRGYQATDSMYYREFLSNRGPEGVVKVYDQFVERITTSVKQALGTEYYVDGNAAGYEQAWHGLESLFDITTGSTEQTVTITTGAYRSANAADIVGAPQGTYAGINMTLGNYGGEQESGKVWPDGLADPEYDFWSPLVVNYTTTSTKIGDGTNVTWSDRCLAAMRYALINCQRNVSVDGQITNIILNRDLYRQFLDAIQDKERIMVTSETGLRALGFKNVTMFDGVEVSWEVGVPSEVGYGVNYNAMALKSMDSTLLRSEGPEYDIHSQAFNAVVSTLSNLQFSSPRNFFKVDAIA
jgi:hypothetical protein